MKSPPEVNSSDPIQVWTAGEDEIRLFNVARSSEEIAADQQRCGVNDQTARTFTCEECGGTFEPDWTDEEAAAEAASAFPDHDVADMAVVCDVCYASIMAAGGSE